MGDYRESEGNKRVAKAEVSEWVYHGDEVAHPSHYAAGEIECKDAMRVSMGDADALPPMAFYWWGCAFKYLWRWHRKGGVTDLRKSQQCIDFLIKELEGGNDGD